MFAADDPTEVARTRAAASLQDFDRFYTSTVGRTVAVGFGLTGNWADAEDLAQDAYVAAHRNWDRIGRLDDPAGWVRRAMTNRAVSRWRRLGREVRALVRLSGRSARSNEADLADPQFWDAVQSLPVRQREVIALFYVQDLSLAEVAQRLGCSESTVKTHLSRARLGLFARLDDEQEQR